MKALPRLGFSLGDPNGVGPETLLSVVTSKALLARCQPIVFGPPEVLEYYGGDTADQINIVPCGDLEFTPSPGKASTEAGRVAFDSLDAARQAWLSGSIDALVTPPINKKTIMAAGFPFAGHTEYLAQADGHQPLMFLCSGKLRVGIVTAHVPLKEVAGLITGPAILEKARLMNESLKLDFGIAQPRIAVLGLNPHAGEEGKLGSEELEIIAPAIAALQTEGIDAKGPYPADGFFGQKGYEQVDGILAMYHDQGLAPFKGLSFGEGVNYTAGLSRIRTSPDHGTAFDIAGKGVANPASLGHAAHLALDILSARRR